MTDEITLNIPNLTKIAEWLEGGATHIKANFDMRVGIQLEAEQFVPGSPTECGTSCCIAGAAAQFFTPRDDLMAVIPEFGYSSQQELRGDLDYFHYSDREVDWDHVFHLGRKNLGLTSDQADQLFRPSDSIRYRALNDLNDFNDPAWAARVVRKLIATGEIDWEGCE